MFEIYFITASQLLFELGNFLRRDILTSVMLNDKSSTVKHTVPVNSSGSACTPVAAPVMMTPSERKNSAARAVSSMLTSDVRAWELWKDAHTRDACLQQQQKKKISLCFGFQEHILGEISWQMGHREVCHVWNSPNHNENHGIFPCNSWCSGWFFSQLLTLFLPVLLFDISEDHYMTCSDVFPISQ